MKPGALVLQRGKRISFQCCFELKNKTFVRKKGVHFVTISHSKPASYKLDATSSCSFLSQLNRFNLALHANGIVVSRRTSIGHLAWRGHRWCRWHHAWLRHSRIFAGVGRWVRCGAWYSGSVGYGRLGGCVRCHHDRGRPIDFAAIPCDGV